MDDDELERLFRWGPVFVDRTWPGSEQIHINLMASAQHHAAIALRDFTKEKDALVDAAVHAGAAVEHLAKCYLATMHPVLLAEKGCDIDSLLHLVGRSDLTHNGPHTIKTVGAVEACKRVLRFLPGFHFNEGTDREIFDTRNSASHLGIAYEVRGAVRTMVRLVDPILRALAVEDAEFWVPYQDVVASIRNEAATERATILNAKYAVSRQNLANTLAGLSPVEQLTLKKVLESRKLTTSDYETRYACPSCGSQGWLICSREYEIPDDPQEGDEIVYVGTDAYPQFFECNVCGLQLDELDMDVAGFPNRVTITEEL